MFLSTINYVRQTVVAGDSILAHWLAQVSKQCNSIVIVSPLHNAVSITYSAKVIFEKKNTFKLVHTIKY